MSKPSRRRQQAGSQPTPSRPAGARPSPSSSGSSAGGGPAASPVRSGTPAPRPADGSVTGARAGRRERARVTYQRSFMERYRSAIVTVAAIAGVALIAIFVFASASASAYACTTEWTPTATASPVAGATPALGYVQPDMGRHHVNVGDKVTYTYCPPASGSHDNASGAGPIAPRLYGPNDSAVPDGWVHNLEHGAMVILYRGRDGDPGLTSDAQTQLKTLFDGFPPSPVCGIARGTSQGPVIARFDEMTTPYAAIVWDRVLPPRAAPRVAPSASASAAPSAAPSTGSGTPSPS